MDRKNKLIHFFKSLTELPKHFMKKIRNYFIKVVSLMEFKLSLKLCLKIRKNVKTERKEIACKYE